MEIKGAELVIDMMSLLYFKSLANHPNMSQVAEELHVTQPTLSKSLTKLEASIGYPLFDRSHGRIYLNENGRIFLDCVDRIFMELNDGIERIRNSGQNGLGTVSYCTNIPTLMENVIPEYLDSHPACRITEMQEPINALLRRLINSEIDFALSTSVPQDSKIVGTPILREKIFLVSSRKIAAAKMMQIRLADVFDYPFVCDEMEVSQAQVKFYCQQAGFVPDIRWVSCDGRLMHQMLNRDVAVALVPAHSVVHMNAFQDFRDKYVYSISDVECMATVNLLFRVNSHFSIAVQDYLKHVFAYLSKIEQQRPDAITTIPFSMT